MGRVPSVETAISVRWTTGCSDLRKFRSEGGLVEVRGVGPWTGWARMRGLMETHIAS
jgi:hypothetical protein